MPGHPVREYAGIEVHEEELTPTFDECEQINWQNGCALEDGIMDGLVFLKVPYFSQDQDESVLDANEIEWIKRAKSAYEELTKAKRIINAFND
jgi:hypothetical protein